MGLNIFEFSPGEKIVDEYFETILEIWNLMIKTIDGWSDTERGKMRNHTPPEEEPRMAQWIICYFGLLDK